MVTKRDDTTAILKEIKELAEELSAEVRRNGSARRTYEISRRLAEVSKRLETGTEDREPAPAS